MIDTTSRFGTNSLTSNGLSLYDVGERINYTARSEMSYSIVSPHLYKKVMKNELKLMLKKHKRKLGIK